MKKVVLFFVSSLFISNVCSQYLEHGMKVLPDMYKFYIINGDMELDTHSPSKKGWYYSQAGVVATPTGYVASYRKSDFHQANTTDIMIAYSMDGKTWSGHHSITHADVWNEQGTWVSPQLSKLNDGRLVVLSDFGQRNTGQNWPMLTDWQKPGRGMSNYLLWSEDEGKIWTKPQKIDNVGGEPGYIAEMKNGTLIYTRTFSDKTDQLWNPPQPWGNIYYKNESVRSMDGGKTWEKPVILTDNPFHGDCEVGVVEYAPDQLLAITRIGHNNGGYLQPSRFVYSNDGGKSWLTPILAPIYGQRPIVHQLLSGKLLVVFRNSWGTPGTFALLFDSDEKFEYQPATFIFDESRCRLNSNIMTINTGESIMEQVAFGFFPAFSPESKVVVEASLKVEESDIHGCNISAGCWIRFIPGRVCLADLPETGFDLNTTDWHDYRIERSNGKIIIYVDGKMKLKAPVTGVENKLVQIGNRMVKGFNFTNIGNNDLSGANTKSITHWRKLHISVNNINGDNIDWHWDSSKGYPDQFRRDRIVALDIIAAPAGHCGYSGFTQHTDGTIVIADYTVGGNGGVPASMSFIRSYVVNEGILTVKR